MNTTVKHILCVAAIIIAFLAFNINNLSAQDQPLDEFDLEIKEWTQSCNQEIISLFENYLNSGSLTLVQLFDSFYIPIPDTEPPKYSTQYDKILEKSLQTINRGAASLLEYVEFEHGKILIAVATVI